MTWRRPHKNCVCYLRFEGADASTTFVDEAGHAWNANVNAQIDTAQYRIGGSSLLLDGVADRITSDDSSDWRLDGGSNSNKWTIGFHVRFAADPGTGVAGFIQQRVDDTEFWGLTLSNNNLVFIVRTASANIVLIQNAWNPAATTWYYVEVVKDGTNGYMMFVDGTQIGTTQTDTDPIPNFAGGVSIGRYVDQAGTASFLNGWIDDFYISKGTADHTANFTPLIRSRQPAGTIAHITGN